jgi:hypothetical protein
VYCRLRNNCSGDRVSDWSNVLTYSFPTTTTTSTTTTTTTAAPTTTTTSTTSTTTSTTTTTTAGPTLYQYDLASGANIFAACGNSLDTTIWGNSPSLASVTKFYTDNTGSTVFNGGSQWYSDYVSVVRINSTGDVIATDLC